MGASRFTDKLAALVSDSPTLVDVKYIEDSIDIVLGDCRGSFLQVSFQADFPSILTDYVSIVISDFPVCIHKESGVLELKDGVFGAQDLSQAFDSSLHADYDSCLSLDHCSIYENVKGSTFEDELGVLRSLVFHPLKKARLSTCGTDHFL